MEAAFCQVSPGSNVLSTGKLTKRYDWPIALKCKSRLAVAQLQEDASCWWTLSLHPDYVQIRMKMTILLFYIFWRNGFIMGIIALYSLLGHDKLHPMCNGWQL